MRLAAVTDEVRQVVRIRELMNDHVLSAAPETPVSAAAAAMVRGKVGSALIMQGTFLAGILTERDVLRAAASGDDLTKAPVSEWMTSDPQYAEPETPTEEAAQIMLRNGFRHLPVLEGRHVCGIVSLRDLFAARIRRPVSQSVAGTSGEPSR
ncbi:MAG: CBS domain-containing protein [Trebonia sp.]